MYVHLLSVSGSPGKVSAERPSIDKEITRHDANVLPLGKDIQTSGLPGTRSTHEGRQCPGPDVAVNFVQKSSSSTRDGNDIIYAFPSEGPAVGEGSFLFRVKLLFDTLGNLLPLPESSIEFGSLLRLLGEHREANTVEGRSLEKPVLLYALAMRT